jgi:hypothetical protein
MFKRRGRSKKEGQSVETNKEGKTVLVCRERYSGPFSFLSNLLDKLKRK